ncbi:Acyl-CoA desaturase [Porphyridium purpureum]|uniref:Acyl-CoA desaturase n=1 Tax=Porphyridium purpureum TaxID=35688 RepID=A0A5J4YU91_PORPP|nr:Acyl-CoA desaturase [Porphyridium purpureum]|eukprot:POR3742..scf227_4
MCEGKRQPASEKTAQVVKCAEHEFDHDKGAVFEKTKASKFVVERDLRELPVLQRINWLSTFIILTPLVAFLVGSMFVPLKMPVLIMSILQYLLTGLGITGGYHRLWSHRAYKASWPVQFVLAMWGAAAFEGSARWWCRNHRAHHRYVDTDQDPYAVHKGFWYAHAGWMILKQDGRKSGRVDISDLNENPLLKFQHKNYLPLALGFGFVLPCVIGHFAFNDFWGALVYACFGRMFFVHQATFCVNSLAHYWGEQPFSKGHTSFDSIITAFVTLGEGYHNYHHEFPHDYRNGIQWYQYDPTKWIVRFLSWFGLTYELVRLPNNEIKKARVQVKQQELDEIKQTIDWGVDVETLPRMTWAQIIERTEAGEKLIAIDDIVYKIDKFLPSHPGGEKILVFWNGRDATRAFNGEVYKHSKSARNLMAHYRHARLVEKQE